MKNFVYELPQEFSNDLRLCNQEILGNYQNWSGT